MTRHPFDDFRSLLRHLPEPDMDAAARTRAIMAGHEQLHGATGEFSDLAAWHSAWQGRSPPMILRPTIAVFAGTNATGAAAANAAATRSMAERAGRGAAAVSALCSLHNLSLKVLDLALEIPVGDIVVQPALDERATAATMAFGMEAVAGGADLLGFGDFGRGNAVHVAALAMMLAGFAERDFAAALPGETAEAAGARAELAARAVRLHRHDAADPFSALARLGTREIAAIAGAILAARMERVPVLLDGHAALGAALVLHAADPRSLAHCRLASRLRGGYGAVARVIGFDPVLELGAGLDGGAGAAMAAAVVKSAAQLAIDLA